ncbi:MAG: hypothetical protein IIZ33_01340 [Erysipelotrichaceae bacterium]|nr:hypothetical protein [Erysipelotrichaceae bacterium]
MKRQWSNPLLFVRKVEGGGAGNWTGDGSGQSSPDIAPFDFETWGIVFEDFPAIYDADGNGTGGEWSDYVKYMTDNGFADFIDPSEEP